VRPWFQEDFVSFLSNNGNSKPIYLWREKLSAPPTDPSDVEHTAPPTESESLGSSNVGDLVDVGKEIFVDLPKYHIQDQLMPIHQKRLFSMITPQPSSADNV